MKSYDEQFDEKQREIRWARFQEAREIGKKVEQQLEALNDTYPELDLLQLVLDQGETLRRIARLYRSNDPRNND
tara:strand:+ start:875 stop:1096 length:222 start_codon:yes stop_codon:yes gene_type:complete